MTKIVVLRLIYKNEIEQHTIINQGKDNNLLFCPLL